LLGGAVSFIVAKSSWWSTDMSLRKRIKAAIANLKETTWGILKSHAISFDDARM
jgi:hypothetical protein